MTSASLPSTNPAPTNSVDIPSGVSLPSMNSNRMSLSSRLEFLKSNNKLLNSLTNKMTIKITRINLRNKI